MFNYNVNKNYFIKEEYIHRNFYHQFDDTGFTDQYQDAVYKRAKEEFIKNKFNTILDIGCGSGFKLIKYFNDHDTTGLEVEQNLYFLNNKYPNKKWEKSDFSKKIDKNFDLVICSDVIEHLLNPDELLKFIYEINFNTCVLSTPDREALYGVNCLGPPENPYHIREWNMQELKQYLENNFKIVDHYLDKGNQLHELKQCQIIVFKK